ncbi:O-antigen ligase family protein [Devosia aurantiaca]|uniref:O-antigen ligase family protein n=1 Tax=Devosia aurantiaca TaxID=2714858 RepID=A0A6M1SMV2_9HYPH|nr:O-antigen ligase family protein [Devosia aurantiaca]NGP17866.1 O-antigen ligase family protein [Devosia aurantiaca]
MGFLDGVSPLGYLLGSDPLAIQILALGTKLVLALTFLRFVRVSSAVLLVASILLAMTLTGALTDAAHGQFSAVATLRYLAFTVSLLLTLALVGREHVAAYCRYLVVTPLLVAACHIALAHLGALASNGSRVFYVGGGHPNLGGEIAAAAAFAAAVAFRPRLALLILAVFFYSALLMQARAALIVIALIGIVVVAKVMVTGWSKNWLALVLVQAPLLGAIVLIANWTFVTSLLDAVLLIDDPSRGVESGAVGRYQQWALGWELFAQSPLFGTGLAVFESGGVDSPHNAFLFGLSQHGILSIAFWAVIARALIRCLKVDPWFAAMALSFAVLLMLNDRFINLNQYPFCFFALVLIVGGSKRGAPLSAPSTRLVPA